MCRLLLFIQPNDKDTASLNYLLDTSPHSLLKQSYLPPYLPNMRYFKKIHDRNPQYNLDGYGLYWLTKDELHHKKSKNPIINIENGGLDKKLKGLSSVKISYGMFFIRNNNFKDVNPNMYKNVQPFKFRNYIFTHNGGFNTYFEKYLPRIKKYVNKDYLNYFQNKSLDSYWLFALFISSVNTDTGSIEHIISDVEKFLHLMYKIKDNTFNISLNILFTNLKSDVHIALRFRTCKQLPPALYYNKTHPLGYMVASEPIDMNKGWKLMGNHLIVVKDEKFKSKKLNPKSIKCTK